MNLCRMLGWARRLDFDTVFERFALFMSFLVSGFVLFALGFLALSFVVISTDTLFTILAMVILLEWGMVSLLLTLLKISRLNTT